jgi:hypothetical protein
MFLIVGVDCGSTLTCIPTICSSFSQTGRGCNDGEEDLVVCGDEC